MNEFLAVVATLAIVFLLIVGPGVIREHRAWKRRRVAFVRIVPNIAAFSAALMALGDATAQATKAFTQFNEALKAVEATKEASK